MTSLYVPSSQALDTSRDCHGGPGDVDHVQLALNDDAIEMRVDEVQSRRGTPVSQQPRLDMLAQQWLLEQRVVVR
jgi:hypothetical protein